MDDGRARNSNRSFLGQRFDEQRKRQILGTLICAPLREDREFRNLVAMIGEYLLGKRLVAGKRQPAGIAARIGLFTQFQVADDVLVEMADAVEFLDQIEDDLRLVSDTPSEITSCPSASIASRTSNSVLRSSRCFSL